MNVKPIKNKYLSLLSEFVSFKTVSTDSAFKKEMKKAVVWLTRLFKAKGFKVFIFKGKECNPVIVAKYVADKSFKTVLVYGHYDVQPAHKSDGWKSDPFKLIKRKDRFVARGVIDNKGQILAHIMGVFNAIDEGKLSSNVTFIIEGNEESGNADLGTIIAENRKLLECDLVLISDGEVAGKHPVLDVSFRGGGNIRVVYKTSTNDRHSGIFGGSIPNAAFELAKMLSKLKEGNAVSFKSFYEGVLPISNEQKVMNEALSSLQAVEELAGVRALVTEGGMDAYSQIGLRPTIEISGFCSGYTGCGFKNIVPGTAEARLNVRTVHKQDSESILREVERFIIKETPSYVDVVVDVENHGNPISLDASHADIVSIKELLRDVYEKEAFHKSCGASIPVVAEFDAILKKPMALVSLCNDDCNMHGVDENFSEYHMDKALAFTVRFWNEKYWESNKSTKDRG